MQQVLGDVPKHQRCRCRQTARDESKGAASVLQRLFGQQEVVMKRVVSSLIGVLALFVACGGPIAPVASSTTAAAVDDDYARACDGVAPQDQTRCPLMRWTKSVEDVNGGVVLHLNDQAPAPADVEKRGRCHRAWMAHDPKNAMPTCPLGSPGITISAAAAADGTVLSLTASAPADVEEVRRRAHSALEH